MRMRRAVCQGSEDEGRALLARTRAIHVAMVSEGGQPKSRAGGQRASRDGSEPTDETEARAVARGEGNDERPRQAT